MISLYFPVVFTVYLQFRIGGRFRKSYSCYAYHHIRQEYCRIERDKQARVPCELSEAKHVITYIVRSSKSYI